jgi:hypothetical protein
MLIELPSPIEANQRVTAAVVPGSLDPAVPTCPIAPSATVAGEAPGSRTVAVTLSVPPLACGGGAYTLRLRLTVQGGTQPQSVTDIPISLTVRFEPSVELRPPATQTVLLNGVTCWLCWFSQEPWLTNFLFPQLTSEARTVEVQNTSIGAISITQRVDRLSGVSADWAEAGTDNTRQLAPSGTDRLHLRLAPETTLRAGTHDRTMVLDVAEAGVTGADPVKRFVSLPVQVKMRVGVSWALLALLAGYLVGRAINLLQDPAFAEKITFLDRLRKVEFLAVANDKWNEVKAELEAIARELEIRTGVTEALKARLSKIEDQLAGPKLAALTQDEERQVGLRAGITARALGWILGGSQPSVSIGADLVRPLVQIAIIVVGLLAGLKINYVDAATFGANGVLDLIPLVVWGATTMAVAKSLDAFKR